MPSDSQNGERHVQTSGEQGEELVEAVQQAIDDWVEEDSIPVQREGEQIIAHEEELVENISIMVAMALDEDTE